VGHYSAVEKKQREREREGEREREKERERERERDWDLFRYSCVNAFDITTLRHRNDEPRDCNNNLIDNVTSSGTRRERERERERERDA
jgi:hypothetical protein